MSVVSTCRIRLPFHRIFCLATSTILVWGSYASCVPPKAWGQTPLASPDDSPVPNQPSSGSSPEPFQFDENSPFFFEEQPQSSEAFNLYRLGPGDSIFVSVQRFPDLSFQATLDLEGNVIVPILGAVSLEGLTLQEAQERIRFGYDRYVVNPDVTLSLLAQRPVQVTIVGEVVKPGFYPLAAPQVSTALLSAGGTTRMADLRAIRIQRQLPDGSLLERTVDLFTPLRDAAALPDVRLQNDDVIVVSRLETPNISEYDPALVARSTLAQQQIIVRVLSYPGNRIGNISLPNGSRFVDALAAIGPDLDNSDLGDIALIRFDPEQGRAVTTELDGKDAIRGDMSQNPPMENNDVVVIGRSFIGRITYALNRFTQPFRDVLGFLLFFDSLSESATDLFGPGGENND